MHGCEFSKLLKWELLDRVSKRDDKMLTQLVKDCMLFGLNEYESLFYIEK